MTTWKMMIGKDAVYSVVAETEAEAQAKIERELTGKLHRQSILERWRAAGKPVRAMRERR
jgi:hypothetical protein